MPPLDSLFRRRVFSVWGTLSSGLQPSEEQKAVILSQEDRIAVVASAGSGKTRVLVDRYLRHVLDEKVDPDRILTITFTRKAAAEMKERIVAGLRAAGALEEAQIAETGPIQTIHALCEQLLRENAVEAGVDRKFEILSEATSNRLEVECVQTALAGFDRDSKDVEALISSLAGKSVYGRPNAPYARLQQAIQEALGQLRGSGVSISQTFEQYKDPATFRIAWMTAMFDSLPGEVRKGVSIVDEDWRKTLRLAWTQCSPPIPNWFRHPPEPSDDALMESQTCGVAQLALAAWACLEARMEELQTFDFNYLEDRTLRMLRTSEEIRSRLSGKFEILMIDEAQDLNPKQHALLEILDPGKTLTVGDDRQSIYGFRLADPELFKATILKGAQRLTRNFRSEAGICNFVDRVFASIWKESYVPTRGEATFDLDEISEENFFGVEAWEMPSGDVGAVATYTRQLIDEDGVHPGTICILSRNGATSQTIQEALLEIGIQSIVHGGAQKFYTRMEVRDLSNILHALADPYNDFSLMATLLGPAVELSLESVVRLGISSPVIDVLSEIDLPEPDRVKLDRFRAWFEPLRSYADRLSAWEVLSRIFVESPFLEALSGREGGRRQIANVRKLLVLATQDSHLGPLEFAEQIREIQQIRHREGDADEMSDPKDVVKLMTIHRAKGLEFPIVILPETNLPLGKNAGEIVYDPEFKLIATHFGGSAGIFYKFLAERHRNRAVAEELRVLYVAMTRARLRLCIGLYPPVAGDSASKRIRAVFGKSMPDTVRLRKPIEPR
jgi:ATP-dependent helicase/nuclease subunit A